MRIRPSTVAMMIQKLGHTESIYNLGGNEENWDNESLHSLAMTEFSMASSVAPSDAGSVVTVDVANLGVSADSEFLLVDVRDEEEFEKYHIKDSVNFPAPNITRDRVSAELHRFRNAFGKMIIIYHFDERPGIDAASKFADKGYENIYLISGGIEVFAARNRSMIEGTELPPERKPEKTRKTGSSTRKTGGNVYKTNRPVKYR